MWLVRAQRRKRIRWQESSSRPRRGTGVKEVSANLNPEELKSPSCPRYMPILSVSLGIVRLKLGPFSAGRKATPVIAIMSEGAAENSPACVNLL